MKAIPDKAEVALEYPDKLYIGSFERSSDFDAHLDEVGVALTLHRGGDESVRKSVQLHIHYALFGEILGELAKSAVKRIADDAHRKALAEAATVLAVALKAGQPQSSANESEMTAAEQVALLHVLE